MSEICECGHGHGKHLLGDEPPYVTPCNTHGCNCTSFSPKGTGSNVLPDGADKPKRIAVTLLPDTAPLAGPDVEPLGDVEGVLRYFATVHERFGNTAVTINAASWGGSALWAQDKLSKQVESLQSQVRAERKRMLRELLAIRKDESRHVAGNYYENWTAGRWRAVNEWIANEFATELEQEEDQSKSSGK